MLKKDFKIRHHLNWMIIAVITIVLAVVSKDIARSNQVLLEGIAIAIILAASLSMVVGFLGELSLGHAGFMCVGAYIGGKVSVILESSMGKTLPNLLISVLIGGAVAAVFGIIIGLPALRLRGDYLAIATLAFGEIVKAVFRNTSEASFGGNLGLKTPRYSRDELFIIAFVFVIITVVIIQNFIRSKHGRAVTAIRDNEIAARATGINVTKYKLAVFTISSFFAGVAGVLYSFSKNRVESGVFDYNYSIEILVMVVLGGMGNLNGSIIAAALITFFNTKLQTALEGDAALYKNLIYALILIIMVIYNNAPALKPIREKLNFKNLLNKIFRKRNDPAHQHDDEAKWDRVPTKIEMNEVLSVDIQPQMSTVDPDKKEGK